MKREAEVKRKTRETDIKVSLKLNGTGEYKINTTIPFLDHMLSQIAKHGLFDIEIEAKGDTEVDYHHTVEDVGIALGDAFKKALGEKEGIKRYGHAVIPLNEALSMVAVDISGRPYIVYNVAIPKEKVGEFDAELTEEFFRAFANSSGMSLHINLMYGNNLHHIVESIFKAAARALDEATSLDERVKGIPSTKGKL
ncbi:MAG: imidazoleglycerol-phosphate dehydratase [Nitrospinae bacterium RIFCSPLOWO2_02_39_17]|nr:MAG: imidazoleglycerol-phosphate dehydratase [Nitrospinae bacterium RIFCSPHIGHO2_12_FULL_39_42]OGW04480.1 MAG: imidazoleglycerol-phosphate dehydratase [Nitrospinae bacterium RIFCSPLOWO2_02_39_17]OGW07617.1 MAG: imidazoleglycerol-phosphate dehydratase [Nitrospinae bacterium RIFCSPLOWO2_12_39_15]